MILAICWRPLLSSPQNLPYSGCSENYSFYNLTSCVITFSVIFHLYLPFTFCIMMSASFYNFYNLVLSIQLLFSEKSLCVPIDILSPLPKT